MLADKGPSWPFAKMFRLKKPSGNFRWTFCWLKRRSRRSPRRSRQSPGRHIFFAGGPPGKASNSEDRTRAKKNFLGPAGKYRWNFAESLRRSRWTGSAGDCFSISGVFRPAACPRLSLGKTLWPNSEFCGWWTFNCEFPREEVLKPRGSEIIQSGPNSITRKLFEMAWGPR